MKTLVLMRHGKSSWEYDVPDIDRPLKKRGINDSQRVSEEFLTKNLEIDLVLSSPANRALSTCKLFIKELKISKNEINVEPNLYDFGGSDVIDVIKSLDNQYNTVILFGHNHAFTSISNIFGNQFIENVPTAGLVVIDFDVESWQTIQNGTTRFTIFPKELKDDRSN